MSYAIKELSFGTCIMEHDKIKSCLFLKLIKGSKTIFHSTIRNFNESMLEMFLIRIKEQDILDMIKYEMTIL